MASIIRIKRSSGILAPSSLKTAELAYAYGVGTQANKGDRLFIGTGDNGAGGATAITVIGGSYFTDMLDHVSGTLTASSAIIVDSDKKIDQLLSGSIVIDGATNSITTPGKILYANLYDSLGALPSASTYHGMFAHVHGTGKGYYSHAGGWIELANKDSINSIDSSFTSFNNNIDNTIDSHLSSTVNVVVGSYGSQIAIPTLKVDSGGRIDSIGTVPLLTTLSFTADSGTGDSVNLRDSVLNFSGSTGIKTKVTDNNLDIRLDSTGIVHSSGNFHTDGNRKYGTGSGLEIAVDDFGRISHVVNTTINAELRVRDDPNNAFKSLFLGGQNDLIVQGGNSINVNLTGPTHSGGGADNTPGTFTIDLDSSSIDTLDSVGWRSHPRFPSQTNSFIDGTSTLEIKTTDGTVRSVPIKFFADSANFQNVIRPHGGIRMGPSNKIELGNTTKYGPTAQLEYNAPSGSSAIYRVQSGNSHFGEGLRVEEQRNIHLRPLYNQFIQTNYFNKGFGHDSAETTNGEASYNIFLGGHLVAKPLFSTYPLQDIGEDSSYTWNNAYFMGTVKAGSIQLTSGGISVDSGGTISADSATFGTLIADSARLDLIQSRTGQNMTIAPNTDSGGTITIGTRYGFSSAQGNHKLDLTNVGLSAGLIKGEAVGTTSFGSWAIPFQSTNLFNDLGFRGGQSHINILDNQDSALTITAMTNLGAATADMVTFNTKDSVTNFHRDVNIAADKFLKLGTLASIRQETVDNQLQIINNGTTSIMGTSVELISSANNPFKSIQVQGHIRPVFQGGGVTFDIGQSTSNTWNNAFFSGNVTSRTNATDSDHLVLKRQLDSDITSVTLDSASWDKDNHNLNLTIGGNVTQVTINEFDNVKIDGNTISSTDSSNQLFIDPFPVGDSGDLVIRGNLIVQGTETTVNSTVVSLNDKNLVLADSAANSGVADGAGITIGGAQYSGTKPKFVFDAATDRWDPNLPFDIPFASLDSAIFFNGVALREVVEDHLDNFFGVDSNAALTLTYNDVANTMTWKANNATKSQVGVSSFDSSNFTVTAGHVAVTVLDGGTY